MGLSICYMTARRQPRVDWFRNSLVPQILPTYDIRVIIVDFFHAERQWPILEGWLHVPPKGSVW